MFSVQLRDNCYVHYFCYHSFYKGIMRRTENSILQQRTGQWGDFWERRKRRKKHLNQRCGAICHFPQGLLSLEDLFQDFEFNLHLTLRAWASVQGARLICFIYALVIAGVWTQASISSRNDLNAALFPEQAKETCAALHSSEALCPFLLKLCTETLAGGAAWGVPLMSCFHILAPWLLRSMWSPHSGCVVLF